MQIQTNFSTIYITTDIQKVLGKILNENQQNKTFILVDENTKKHCLPLIEPLVQSMDYTMIEINSGENYKSISTLEKVWSILAETGADRNSLLVNLGGGIISDLGGFAGSTFKRGMKFINIPTTLLSQVDASVGGKTGINFLGLKNEIGVFNHPKHVFIDSRFNRTLDKRNILSGWAEMLKHALISDEKDWEKIILHDIKTIGFKELNQLIARSIHIKNHFVEQDPREKGIRKALNFGHTMGHAFESLFMNTQNEILHGEAVAHGMICELFLSNMHCGFSIEKMGKIVKYIMGLYSKLKIEIIEFDKIFDLIGHDKKNEGHKLNFTLLEDLGKIKVNVNCSKDDIIKTLNWYTSL
ncbi:MAG: 3-dehydroquinate synthase [Marinilabiliales bacterium]|nr:MAG: 3-dehydroquinate synthase [Marinilabiliales bacterium]